MGSKPQIRLVNITLLHFLTRIIFYVFVFVAGYVTSRALSRHDFGQIQYISLWVNLSWIFLGLGVPTTVSRHFTQAFSSRNKPAIRKLVGYSAIACVFTSLLTVVLFVLLYRYVNIAVSFWPVVFFALSQCLLSYLQVFIQSLYKYRTTLALNVMASVAGFVFLLATIQPLGVMSYIYMLLIVNAILCTGYVVTIGRALFFMKPAEAGIAQEILPTSVLVKTSLFYAASAILAGILWQRFEISLLKEYFSYEKIAVYGIAFTVIALFAEPLKMVPSVLMYYFAGIGEQGEKAALQFSRYFRHFCWLVIFAGIFVWADAVQIVTVLYTDKYIESVYYLRILMVGMIPGVCSYVLMNMHIGLGKAKFLVTQDVIGAVSFLVLLFLGNHFFSLYGVAWAKSIAMIICVMLGLWYTGNRLKFPVPYIPMLLSALLSAALLLPLANIGSSSLVLLMIKAVVLFGVYVFVSRKLRIVDRELIDDVIRQVRTKAMSLVRK